MATQAVCQNRVGSLRDHGHQGLPRHLVQLVQGPWASVFSRGPVILVGSKDGPPMHSLSGRWRPTPRPRLGPEESTISWRHSMSRPVGQEPRSGQEALQPKAGPALQKRREGRTDSCRGRNSEMEQEVSEGSPRAKLQFLSNTRGKTVC